MEKELNKILDAREQRAEIRNDFAHRGLASLSLTFNIPGYPKYNDLTKSVFDQVLNELKIFLIANRVKIRETDLINTLDEAGHLFLVALSENGLQLTRIKEITETFEETFSLGRIIDVDIFDKSGRPISSGKKKKCIICGDKSAVNCMRNQTHNYEDLRTVMFSLMGDYQTKQRREFIIKKLSEISTKSLLYEVSLSPKPGLVDFHSNGSHKDMNYYTFLNSTSALAPFWGTFARAGFDFKGDISQVLPLIRQIGLKAEMSMFSATNEVNTQKGLVFLLGLSVFITAYLSKEEDVFDEDRFIETIQQICHGMVDLELHDSLSNNTHGEETFKKYGLQGAGPRYEAERGFPMVFNLLLPYLELNLNKSVLLDKEAFNGILQKALLKIMSELDDSNVLYRKGLKMAEDLKMLASKAFEGRHNYKKLSEFCLKENISPGGSADILALSLFFFFVKQELNLR